jgi:hypothetical protein
MEFIPPKVAASTNRTFLSLSSNDLVLNGARRALVASSTRRATPEYYFRCVEGEDYKSDENAH